jgi:serine protease Do
MNNSRKIILSIGLLLTILVAIYFLVHSNNKSQDFYEADNNYSVAGYQQKSNTNDEITNSRKNIITETVKKVSPAVVGINVTEIRQYESPFGSFFDDPFFKQFFGGRNYNRTVKELGSGFIISPDGYIVTNDHVAGNASEITVTMTNGKQYQAKLIGTDKASDIALIKVEAENLPYEILGNSDDIMIGEWVIALGNPFGLFEINDNPTVTVGVVSSTGMNLEPMNNRYYLNMIQTDAAINGGNSGGPLVNSNGEVIGINTLIFTAGGNQGSIGLGFAIPINKMKKIIKELKESGKIDRDFSVGLRIQSIDEGIAKYYNLNTTKGVIITQVIPGTPADKTGIKVGDIITQVEGYKINDSETLESVFQEFRTGQTITLDLLRDGNEIVKKMTLAKKQ